MINGKLVSLNALSTIYDQEKIRKVAILACVNFIIDLKHIFGTSKGVWKKCLERSKAGALGYLLG